MTESPSAPQLFPDETTSDSPDLVFPEVAPGQLAPGESATYDPNARPDSEARIDQGHGKREPEPDRDVIVAPLASEITELPVSHRPAVHQPTNKLFELPGKDGRSNELRSLTPVEAQRGLTEEVIDARNDATKLGVAAARKMLDRSEHSSS